MAASNLAGLQRLAHADISTQEVCESVIGRILAVVDADSFFAMPTDPRTGLSIGGFGVGVQDGVSACYPSWQHEFLIPDYNKFADLTPAEPVGDLRRATGGRPSRSARHRTLSDLIGMQEELRATLFAGGRPWGKLQLGRRTGSRPFTDREYGFLRAAAPLAGAALRRALLREPVKPEQPRGPGVVIVDEAGAVVHTSAEADRWLAELRAGWEDHAPGLPVHPELLALAVSTLSRDEAGPARMRLRTPQGTWVMADASPLGATRQVAIVLAPATGADLAPVLIEAYRLTPREAEVARLLGRGLSADDVAGTLFLSRHTVRDHVKAIYEKVGVRTRAELTCTLFTAPGPAA